MFRAFFGHVVLAHILFSKFAFHGSVFLFLSMLSQLHVTPNNCKHETFTDELLVSERSALPPAIPCRRSWNDPIHSQQTRSVQLFFCNKSRRLVVGDLPAVFPLWKFYTEQMFVLVRVRLRNHADTQQ